MHHGVTGADKVTATWGNTKLLAVYGNRAIAGNITFNNKHIALYRAVLNTGRQVFILSAMVYHRLKSASVYKMLNTHSKNLSNKMTRDNFPEKELRQIAEALDCELESYLVMKDTGERV
jgi:hypothetical protein